MTTPPYAELVAFVRSEGEAIVSASRQGLDVHVPTCGDWTVADLCRHVGRTYGRVAHVVSERSTTAPDFWPEPDDGVDIVEWMAESLDELVTALTGCDPDTPVWNWTGASYLAAFWARRMAHESAVHRFDAQRAFGVAQPVDTDLAADGLDEFVDVLGPRIVERDDVSPAAAATYRFASTEGETWHVRLDDAGIARADADAAADVTVRGTTSALLLALYNRVPWSSLEVDGDAGALDRWSAELRF